MKFYKPTLKRTIYLQSSKAKTTSKGSKYNTFTWQIPPITIYEMAEVEIGCISSINASTTAIYTFRLINPMSHGNCSISADNGSPILFSVLLNNLNATFRGDLSILIGAQTINNITIQVSDDTSNPDGGIATIITFVLCMVISEFQLQTQEISNPMADAYPKQGWPPARVSF